MTYTSPLRPCSQRLLSLACLFTLLLTQSHPCSAAAEEPAYSPDDFSIGSVHVELIEDSEPTPSTDLFLNNTFSAFQNERLAFEVPGIAQIISTGTSLWQLISKNEASAEFASASSNALPAQVTDWTQLEGWQTPHTQTYRIRVTNAYGVEVVSFTYRILFTPGGSNNGKGQYLSHITVLPGELSVTWGYHFSATASIPNTFNAGTRAWPIAAAEILVEWKIETLVKKTIGSSSYLVRGDGHIQQI